MDYILFLMVTVKEQKANEAFCSLHHVFQVCLKIFFSQDATKGEDSNCPHSYQFCFFFFISNVSGPTSSAVTRKLKSSSHQLIISLFS